MISTDQGHFQHQQDNRMSSVPELAAVAGSMVRREKYRVGCADTARASVARRVRLGVGSLTNIIKRRVKSVSAEVRGWATTNASQKNALGGSPRVSRKSLRAALTMAGAPQA